MQHEPQFETRIRQRDMHLMLFCQQECITQPGMRLGRFHVHNAPDLVVWSEFILTAPVRPGLVIYRGLDQTERFTMLLANFHLRPDIGTQPF